MAEYESNVLSLKERKEWFFWCVIGAFIFMIVVLMIGIFILVSEEKKDIYYLIRLLSMMLLTMFFISVVLFTFIKRRVFFKHFESLEPENNNTIIKYLELLDSGILIYLYFYTKNKTNNSSLANIFFNQLIDRGIICEGCSGERLFEYSDDYDKYYKMGFMATHYLINRNVLFESTQSYLHSDRVIYIKDIVKCQVISINALNVKNVLAIKLFYKQGSKIKNRSVITDRIEEWKEIIGKEKFND